ncbi:hypothetical protein ACWC9U_13980 [Streptomyces sp. 900116325]
MLAHELSRTGLVDHGLAPVLRGEGDVHLLALLVECGDVLATGVSVPHRVRERVQYPPVLGRLGELQLLGQVEHHRAVPADLPVQQHLPEVAMVGGDLLDLLVLLVEPTEILDRLGDGAEPASLHQQGLGHRQDRRGDLAAQLSDLVHRRLVVQALQSLTDFGGHGRSLLNRLMGGATVVDVLGDHAFQLFVRPRPPGGAAGGHSNCPPRCPAPGPDVRPGRPAGEGLRQRRPARRG